MTLNHGGRGEAVRAGNADRRRFLEILERRGKGDFRKGATGLGMAKAGRRSGENMTIPLTEPFRIN
jgi:hypothetical protein